MGTKPAKGGHLASGHVPPAPSNVLKCAPRVAVIHKKVFTSQKGLFAPVHGRTRFAKVGPPWGRGQIC